MASELYTLEEAQKFLDQAHASRLKTLENLKYSVGSGELEIERSNLKTINDDIAKWEKVVFRLKNKRTVTRIRYGVPRG